MGAFAPAAVGAGVGLASDIFGLNQPDVSTSDPNTGAVAGLQPDIENFLRGIFGGGESPFQGMTSDLQRQSTDAIGAFLNANPEQQTFEQLSPGLMDIFGGGSAEGIGQAALPVFQRQLQASLGGLSSSAPGRFGTAFEAQGVDLASRAAQDFALLEAQARQQEMGNRLGAAGLMGTLAGQAGQGAFGRALGAGQLGLGQTAQNVNPMLQLLMGGLQFGRPSPADTVVGGSPLDAILGGASTGILAGQSFGRSPNPFQIARTSAFGG